MSQFDSSQHTAPDYPAPDHPARDELQSFASGTLDAGKLEVVANHLLHCQRCCCELDSLNTSGSLESRLSLLTSNVAGEVRPSQAPASVLRWLICSSDSPRSVGCVPAEMPDHVLQYRLLREVARCFDSLLN